MNICGIIVTVLFLILLTTLMKKNDRISWGEAIKTMLSMVLIASALMSLVFGAIWFVTECPLC